MKKVNVFYDKLYYGFPVILVSYYDIDGTPNVTTVSSSYTLKDMMALGFSTKGYALNRIKEVSDFVVNIADTSLNEAGRLNPNAFDEILYIGDGDSKGFPI